MRGGGLKVREKAGVEKREQRGDSGEKKEGEKECDCRGREGEGGGRARGRREWMTSSVGTEGYFKNMIGRMLLRTPLGLRHRRDQLSSRPARLIMWPIMTFTMSD